jgi:hypothetical protein
MGLIDLNYSVKAQYDTSIKKAKWVDSSKQKLNMDAVYNRPFLTVAKTPIAIGGYLEANSQYASTDGISEGLSFQMRRMTLFFSSTIGKKIKFLSELELEDGTKNINLEFAAMDIEFHSLLNVRGGIIMNPIGGFNQNHDGPRWDFIDRPISATSIIPSTLSNVGFGLYGKYFSHAFTLGYEAYLTNGFDDHIIQNDQNRTSLAAGKLDPERFEESKNGMPMFTGKMAIRNRQIGELGLSYMSGVYNTFQTDGIVIDHKRRLHVISMDFNTSQLSNRLGITGEVTKVLVEIPENYNQTFGKEQFGGYIDLVGTIIQKPMLGWPKAKMNLVLRLEYVDYNQGKFIETKSNRYDHLWAIVPGMAFRPLGSSVLRFNYRYQEQTDILGNPASRMGVIQFGFSSYF